jgi:type II secretory pathway pseudopilin PulG
MQTPHQQSGFTLIETILYIGLFVLIMSSVILATYSMIASTDKSQYRSLMHNEAQFVIAKFNWTLNGATSVTINGTTLTAQYPSGPNKVLSLDGDKVKLDDVVLNSDIAPVVPASFIFTPSSGTVTSPTMVQLSFELNNPYYNETFTAKKLVR